MTNKPIIYKFFKDFTNNRKQINRVVRFSQRFPSNILNLKKQNFLRHILKNSANIYMKIRIHSSSEPSLEYK